MKTQNEKSEPHGVGSSVKLSTVVLFIAGNAIGASVLCLPVVMRKAGFIPAAVACILMCAVMIGAQLLMARMFIGSGANDLPGMFRAKLGPRWASLFNISYFTLFFCLLVAYWVGTKAVLGTFSHSSMTFWLSICCVACCAAFGFCVASKMNSVLTYLMSASFLCLIVKTFTSSGLSLTETVNFGATVFALPIVICSYCFHGAIPLICKQLDCNWKNVKKAVILGALFPLVFNLSILFVGFRILTADDLAEGAKNGWPVFVALAHRLSSKSLVNVGNLFSIFAILSSLIGVTTTTNGAVRDICANQKASRVIAFAVVLLAPLMVANSHPEIFIRTLEFSGGILSNFMVCILPIIVLIRERTMKLWHLILLAISVGILGIEVSKLVALIP